MRLCGFTDARVTVDGAAAERCYDAEKNTLCFTMVTGRDREAVATFEGAEIARDDWKERTKRRMLRLQTDNDEKNAIWDYMKDRERSESLRGTIGLMCRTPGMMSCLEETMFGQEV